MEILTPKQKVFGTARGLLLRWRDNPILLHEVHLAGELAFIQMMRKMETPGSINEGLTDAEYGAVFAEIDSYVRLLAAKGGHFRKRKDPGLGRQELAHLIDFNKGKRRPR